MDRFILIIVWLNIFAANLTAQGNFTLRAARFDYRATHANEITGGLIPNNCVAKLLDSALSIRTRRGRFAGEII
jgi:hypothetical protein